MAAHVTRMLVAPKPEEEDSDYAYDEYNSLSVGIPETMLSEEEMLNLVLKEPMRMILEEQAIQGRAAHLMICQLIFLSIIILVF